MNIKNIIDGIFGAENSVWASLLATKPVDQFGSMIENFIPFVLLGVCVLLLFFGKKLVPLWKVLVCFFATFFLVLTPFSVFGASNDNSVIGFIDSAIGGALTKTPILQYAVAAVLGVVVAILSKFVSILVYVGGFAAAGYFVVAGGALDKIVTLADNIKTFVAIGAAVVLAVLAILLRKFIAKFLTAAIGSYGIFWILVNKIIGAEAYQDMIGKIGVNSNVVGAAAFVILFFIGFLVQIKTNRKYKV